MRTLIATLFLVFISIHSAVAQEYFTIQSYNVAVEVNEDASLDIDEDILVHFTEPRHGIYRFIPYKYPLQSLPAATEKANRQMEFGGYAHIIIENIKVEGWNYEITTEGDNKVIKIGSANNLVDGDQTYSIHYRVLNAINFFTDHSELYYNLIGNQWNTTIESVHFDINLYKALDELPFYFVATGPAGSKENNTVTKWTDNKVFSGSSTQLLNNNEGVTIGIRFPKGYLTEQNYRMKGVWWLALPVIAFVLFFWVWKRWGKDERITIQTEYYPPDNISPSLSGYLIDDKLNRRDLTALVPYWGAGGYLMVKETENKLLFGLIKNSEYEFIKLKDLPTDAKLFEKTLFNGIFESGDKVKLSDLKDVLYKSMNKAKSELESEVDKDDYYVRGSRGTGALFIIVGIISLAFGIMQLLNEENMNNWFGIAFIANGIIVFVFGLFMGKKTKKGTFLYQKLAGFKEFIKLVEKDRLQEFLKQDEHYFDKVLPYAIVFNMADTWKDKLKGLEIPPPTWYVGNYNTFSTVAFMNSLDHSMSAMTNTFYSSPSGSGSSGGSFGGGGSSGGGFGGGGGGSW